jgi:hypothetical protein
VSILSDFEDRIGDAVEGLFAGAFRSPVQPVELAKSLAKAMDDGRAIGVGKVYAPVTYTIQLSREDRRNLGEFTGTLEGELATYLTDHAREQGYDLVAKPAVSFAVANDLKLGRFRVGAELAPPPSAEEPVPAPAAAALAPAPVAPARDPVGATVTLADTGHDIALSGDRMVVGRLQECDIVLADVNVSRHHAAFVHLEEGGWGVTDLDSTNGTYVNGERVQRAVLKDGDIVEIGATRLIYHGQRG